MSTSTIWHHESSNELFSVTKSHSRFKFISRFITFDDKASRTEHWKTDNFACMRELFHLMSLATLNAYILHLCCQSMKLCNRTVEPLVSSSTIQISKQNMAYYSGVSVIQQPHIHITSCNMLASPKLPKVILLNTM